MEGEMYTFLYILKGSRTFFFIHLQINPQQKKKKMSDVLLKKVLKWECISSAQTLR